MRSTASLTFDRPVRVEADPIETPARSGKRIHPLTTEATPTVTLEAPAVSRVSWWNSRSARARGGLVRGLQASLVPSLLLLAWWWSTSHGLISEKVLPSPLAVLTTFKELLAGGEIATHLGVSLGRVARGATLGVTVGLALGVALGFSRTVETWIGPTFRTVAQIPSIALIPLLMMVLGIDDKLKLFIMAKACVIPIAFTTADGIRNISKQYLEIGDVFRLRRWTRLTRIIIPGALPSISSGVRQGLAHVWVSLVAVEVLASAEGIGYLMTWGRLIFQLDVVLVCVAIIGVIGFALDFGLKRVETYFLRWRGNEAV